MFLSGIQVLQIAINAGSPVKAFGDDSIRKQPEFISDDSSVKKIVILNV